MDCFLYFMFIALLAQPWLVFDSLKLFITGRCTGPISLSVATIDRRTSSIKSSLDAALLKIDELNTKLDETNRAIRNWSQYVRFGDEL